MSKYSEFFLLGKADYVMIGDKLRLRKFGSWLAEEGWTKEEQARQRASFSLKAVDLARKIAKEQEISEEEAFDVLQKANESRSEVFEQYATEIDELMALMPSGREQFEELVTLFFRNRGQVKVDKKWEATDEWSDEDTRMLPKAMLALIEEFMASEDEPLEPAEEDVEAPKKAS
jgi:thioesterase domain-containing protein